MAHSCPECGSQCYCNGDWDDCCNDFDEDVDNCIHWMECKDNEDDYEC